MTHQDAFLQAIVEEPDDDTMRLIFADWLDEHDDPRGEFIRAQCEILRLPPGHPRRRQLHARAAELFHTHAHDWVTQLRPFLLRCWFRRGFIESATVRGQSFMRAPERLFRLAPLRDYLVDLHDVTVPPEVLSLIPEPLARRWSVLPMAVRRGTVLVATPFHSDLDTLVAVEFYLQRPVRFVPVEAVQLFDAHVRHFGPTPEAPQEPVLHFEYHTDETPATPPLREGDDERATQTVLQLLEEAVQLHADEVRIEAFAGRMRVRFALHGIRVDRADPPLRLLPLIVARFKEMAGLDPGVSGVPMDGGGIVALDGHALEMVVHVRPAVRGEAVTVELNV